MWTKILDFIKKKKVFVIIGILIIITGIITTVIIVNKNSKPKEISDEQWVINQRTHINNLVNLSENIDDVYTLYIIGAMSESDFMNELQMLKGQYTVYLLEYEQQEQDAVITLGTETQLSQIGRKALNDLNHDYDSLFKDTLTEAMTPRTPEATAYLKMAYLQQMREHFVSYIAAYQTILANNPDVHEIETSFEQLISIPEVSELEISIPEISESSVIEDSVKEESSKQTSKETSNQTSQEVSKDTSQNNEQTSNKEASQESHASQMEVSKTTSQNQ